MDPCIKTLYITQALFCIISNKIKVYLELLNVEHISTNTTSGG